MDLDRLGVELAMTNEFSTCGTVRSDDRGATEIPASSGRGPSSILTVEADTDQDVVERKRMEARLVYAEKMASLGGLTAGMTHAINNALCFVNNNLEATLEYVQVLLSLIDGYESLAAAARASDFDTLRERLAAIDELRGRSDLDFIRGDVEVLRGESTEGVRRISSIVKGIQAFARSSDHTPEAVDVNECLETTLDLLTAEFRLKAEVVKEFRPLPSIRCRPGQLNQAFLNILLNAGQSLSTYGRITVRTEAVDGAVIVRITDTGRGIPPEHMPRLFTPFFSTRGEGNGAGLGLATAYGIVQGHGGGIDVESEVGKGTTVTVRVPIGG